MGFLKRMLDKVDPSDSIPPVKAKVESLVADTFEAHAQMKEKQASDLKTAAVSTTDEIERKKLLELAEQAKEQAHEAQVEVLVRQEYLQSRVDVRTGRL